MLAFVIFVSLGFALMLIGFVIGSVTTNARTKETGANIVLIGIAILLAVSLIT